MKLNALRDKRNAKVKEARGILDKAAAEDRDLTDEERQQLDALDADINNLNADIQRVERLEAIEETDDQPAAPKVTTQGARGPEAKKEFESLGQFLHAVRFNPNDQRLSNLYNENAGMNAEQSMGDGASGGFAVPEQFRSTLLEVSPQEAIFRPRAEVIPAGSPPDSAITIPALDQESGSAPESMYGGVKVNWIGEGDAKPETDMKLREVKLQPHEVAGHTVVTDKLLRNWGAASTLIERQLRRAVVQAEDYAFLRGDGVAKPLGVLNAGALYGVNRGTANQIDYDDIVNMMARLRGQGIWLYNKSALPQLMKMEDTAGHLIWMPSAREGQPSTLAGLPVMENERNPQLGNLGDLVLVDPSMYLIKDGSGPFVAASEHVHFVNNKTVIKIFWNVDGQPWLTQPIKDESGYEVSPFVALDVPEA